MAEPQPPPPPNPNRLVSATTPADPPPPPPPQRTSFLSLPKRPGIRVTTEFDSDSSVYLNKISCKFFDSFAKLKLSFQNNDKGEISDTQLSLASKYLTLNYDLEEQNALVSGSFNVGPGLQLTASHNVKAQQGEVAVAADLAGPAYKFQLSSVVPPVGLPRATFKFPSGEVSVEEKEDEEVKRALSVNGIVKGNLLSGVCMAQFSEEILNLRYLYKDEQLAFIPSISLPSNALSFAFKRRFGPSDKLSYWYNFDSDTWSTAYKHTVGKDYKLKVGYDSGVRLGWASLWVGDESGKAKTAPMKMKTQFMLQVPRDDIRSAALMLRVKKRWDI